jgi:mannan endo-1,4-beta-mannosidase
MLLFGAYQGHSRPTKKILKYMKSLGHGTYLFGQVGTWVHNENPDIDDETNWVKKVYDHTGKIPRYGCITYDFDDNPFTDDEWNNAARKMWERGMIVGIYSWYANPAGGKWNDPLDIDPIFADGDNPTKSNFYKQMDRMAANLQWLENQKIPVVYTPFVESDDKNKWHAKEVAEQAIKLYQLVHDYFTETKKLKNIIWAYHTTQRAGASIDYYPGDEYVDVIGKSAYGMGLVFTEYDWAVEKKKNQGKIIWWAELGIRGEKDPPRECLDVLDKLENTFPELAGFVFWSDTGFYNVTGNLHGAELMSSPKIVTLK